MKKIYFLFFFILTSFLVSSQTMFIFPAQRFRVGGQLSPGLFESTKKQVIYAAPLIRNPLYIIPKFITNNNTRPYSLMDRTSVS